MCNDVQSSGRKLFQFVSIVENGNDNSIKLNSFGEYEAVRSNHSTIIKKANRIKNRNVGIKNRAAARSSFACTIFIDKLWPLKLRTFENFLGKLKQ